MKTILLVCLTLFASVSLFAQSASAVKGPVMTWTDGKVEHDFGKIPVGKPVTYHFTFTNTGDANVQVTNAKASCGCTTPKWSSETIAPGGTGYVDATFNAASMGMFNKTVTVTTNAGANVILHLKGEVVAQ